MLAIFSTSYKAIRKLYNKSLRNLCYQSSREIYLLELENQTSHPYGAPCYGNFDKQSTAPKQPLVTIPSPMVMPIFVAQNPQLSYTTYSKHFSPRGGRFSKTAHLFTGNDLCYPTPSSGRGAHRHGGEA